VERDMRIEERFANGQFDRVPAIAAELSAFLFPYWPYRPATQQRRSQAKTLGMDVPESILIRANEVL
jgi:hypothetical protein